MFFLYNNTFHLLLYFATKKILTCCFGELAYITSSLTNEGFWFNMMEFSSIAHTSIYSIVGLLYALLFCS